jgi:RNA polymerase subunit RPABC4/transcription elongation factor Spt4
MVQICSNCSVALDADAAFCKACGSPAVEAINCPQCAQLIKADAEFCQYCTYDLSTPPEAFAAETPPAPQSDDVRDNPASLVSPSGAAFAVICFFLPWLEMSGCGSKQIATGAEFAKTDSILWLLPLMGLIAFAVYFICKKQNALSKARLYIIGISAIALCFFIYKLYGILAASKYFDKPPTPDANSGIKILSGSYGTIIGFILAIVGCFFISRTIAARVPANAGENTETL